MSRQAWQRVTRARPSPERVLVLGSTGMVGRAWCQLLSRLGTAHTGVHRPDFDLADPGSIDRALSGDYDLVVNAAAWTDVDGAEADEQGAARANAQGVEQIARVCERSETTLITYSTDYVFDGRGSVPYPIDAPIDPINAYGRSKALGEALLRDAGENHILIRTSWVHAPWGKNFVLTMRDLTTARESLSVVDDQQGRPSSALSIARGSLDLFTRGALGTWHLTDAGECSWHGLACAVRDHLNADCTIDACTSEAFPRPAARPGYSVLDIEATQGLIGDRPRWQSTVAESLDLSATERRSPR